MPTRICNNCGEDITCPCCDGNGREDKSTILGITKMEPCSCCGGSGRIRGHRCPY